MEKWKDIEEELPWENTAVLVCDVNGVTADDREPEIGYYESGYWFWVDRTNFNHYDTLYPTHWMPLPKIPKVL